MLHSENERTRFLRLHIKGYAIKNNRISQLNEVIRIMKRTGDVTK